MERMLQKMAQQLNAYDEASLTDLWEKYASIVERFEPTKRWEEATLIFSLIQAVRLKNQLFNQHLAANLEAARIEPPPPPSGMEIAMNWIEKNLKKKSPSEDTPPPAAPSKGGLNDGKPKKRCQVLRFSRGKGHKPV